MAVRNMQEFQRFPPSQSHTGATIARPRTAPYRHPNSIEPPFNRPWSAIQPPSPRWRSRNVTDAHRASHRRGDEKSRGHGTR